MADQLTVMARVAQALAQIGAPYFISGSIASAIYGVVRATQDIDIVIHLAADDAPRLVQALEPEFLVDELMVHDSLALGESFNILHRETLYKVDLFPLKADDWGLMQLQRRVFIEAATAEGEILLAFASPEDTLLHKLVWYRLGREVSERQWRDVIGILQVRGASLDAEYLVQWAEKLGVKDLLQQAWSEFGFEAHETDA